MAAKTVRIDVNNIDPRLEIFGTLHPEDDMVKTISYIPFQISKYGIGIISRAGLNVLCDLVLRSPKGPIRLRVLNVETNDVPEHAARYNLMSVDMAIDLEEIFASDVRVRPVLGESMLQFARFQTSPPAILQARTFGSTNPYTFKTINASKTGSYVVSFQNNKRVPFRESTLIEWELIPNDYWLLRKIQGVGRVAHQSAHAGKNGLHLQYYGIELKEFHGDGDLIWRQALENLERQTIDRQLKAADRNVS